MLEERRRQLSQMSRHERRSWGKHHHSTRAKETETNIKRITRCCWHRTAAALDKPRGFGDIRHMTQYVSIAALASCMTMCMCCCMRTSVRAGVVHS
ncbi:MAG TPA: hypothetical protein VLV87_01405 [Gammaproteobacteria bacterium]|nr:hypothetical protein [Gammaproteobacteria bacterium]